MDGESVTATKALNESNDENDPEKHDDFEIPKITVTRLDGSQQGEEKQIKTIADTGDRKEGKDTSKLQDDIVHEVPLDDVGDSKDSNTTAENPLSEEEQAQLQRRILLIFTVLNFIGFLGSFSYWMQSGVLPYLTRKLGVYSEVFGYMQSTYAFYQMIGSPIFGRCGDVFGCRLVMIVSELSSMVSYGSLAFASNIFLLFMSRVPAIAMHNLQGSYMIITDITLPNERAKMLGILGVSHGLGMIVGSFTGGIITEVVGEESTPLVAGTGNLIASLLVALFIPADTKKIRRQLENMTVSNVADEQITLANLIGLTEIAHILQLPNIKYLLFVKITSAFPFTLVYSFFSMAIMDYFHLGPKINGLVLSYIGGLVILVQGGLIGIITKHFKDFDIIKYAIFLNTSAFLFLIVAENVYMLCTVFLPLVIGGTVSHIVITACITKLVPIEYTGSALGLTLALHALIRSIAPTIGGLLFNYIGWPFFGVVGYGMSLYVSVYMVLVGNDNFAT